MLSLSACDKGGAKPHADPGNGSSTTSTTGAISMCKLMPKEEVNSTIGSVFTIAEATEDPGSSACHYSTETDPAGLSLNMDWIRPGDYSSPAEHAALQKAGLGGAKLGGKLEAGMVPGVASPDGGPLHIPSGPIEGVGDEAMQNMLLLTARKGDYVLMVQIIPDLTKLMQDSTAGRKVLEQEKKLALAVLSKV
ncbi:MAG: hypothetical protein M3Y05_07040 [Gemmatimonadota bacterium]|nr:hypothetical protein [Gemmatimonadota bacterium]